MPARKGNNRVQTKLAQFTYDHRQLNDRMSKIRKNATELGKFLDSMPPKKGEKEENKNFLKNYKNFLDFWYRVAYNNSCVENTDAQLNKQMRF